MKRTSQANRNDVHRRRIEAQLRGEVKFEVAIPCNNGHFIRYASNVKCAQCQIDAMLARRKRQLKMRE